MNDCIIEITTNQMSLFIVMTISFFFLSVCSFCALSFIGGYESESRFSPKNHQSTFTAIMSDIRMRSRKNSCRHNDHSGIDESHRLSIYLYLLKFQNHIFLCCTKYCIEQNRAEQSNAGTENSSNEMKV